METIWIFGPLWVLFGITAAIVANSRGGDGFGAFLAGLFLGPLGLVIAFFMGSPEQRDRRDVGVGLKKICPRCAETVLRAALVCKHCGGEFDLATDAAPSVPQPQQVDVKRDPVAFDADAEAPVDRSVSAATDRWILGGVVAVVVVLLLVMTITLTNASESGALGTSVETNADILADNLQAAADALDAAADNLSSSSMRRDDR